MAVVTLESDQARETFISLRTTIRSAINSLSSKLPDLKQFDRVAGCIQTF